MITDRHGGTVKGRIDVSRFVGFFFGGHHLRSRPGALATLDSSLRDFLKMLVPTGHSHGLRSVGQCIRHSPAPPSSCWQRALSLFINFLPEYPSAPFGDGVLYWHLRNAAARLKVAKVGEQVLRARLMRAAAALFSERRSLAAHSGDPLFFGPPERALLSV